MLRPGPPLGELTALTQTRPPGWILGRGKEGGKPRGERERKGRWGKKWKGKGGEKMRIGQRERREMEKKRKERG